MKRTLAAIKWPDYLRLLDEFPETEDEGGQWLFGHGFLPERIDDGRVVVWEREITNGSYCLLAPWVPRPDRPDKTAWYVLHRGGDGLWTARVETREGDTAMSLFCGNRRRNVQRALLDALDFVEGERRRFENGGKGK